jgi:hypothetical protein
VVSVRRRILFVEWGYCLQQMSASSGCDGANANCRAFWRWGAASSHRLPCHARTLARGSAQTSVRSLRAALFASSNSEAREEEASSSSEHALLVVSGFRWQQRGQERHLGSVRSMRRRIQKRARRTRRRVPNKPCKSFPVSGGDDDENESGFGPVSESRRAVPV